jgi:hypothetical protein
LTNGEVVRWETAAIPVDARLDDSGETLVTEIQINRRSLINGLFHGVEGMCIGGTRRLEIDPHLERAVRGVPGVIPANAMLVAEITILGRRFRAITTARPNRWVKRLNRGPTSNSIVKNQS